MPWSIDNLVFTTADRELVEAEPVDVELTRTGQDGTGFQVDAYRAATQQVTTTVEKAINSARAFREACKKLERSTPALTDQHGTKWIVYVRRVRLNWRHQITGTYLIMATWHLVPRSVRP